MDKPAQNVLCRYRYDALDRLVSSTPAARVGVQRFYQKSRLTTEIQGALCRTVFQHDDVLLAQRQCFDEVMGTTLLATDFQRSVLQLVDKTGTEAVTYAPYGHHPADSGSSRLLGFNGEHRDPVTGHYLLGNGYRAFNPVLMRFNRPDSLSPFGEGGLNAYAYCEGDPVNFEDSSGHIAYGALLKLGLSQRSNFVDAIQAGVTAQPVVAAVTAQPTVASVAVRTVTAGSSRVNLVTSRRQLLAVGDVSVPTPIQTTSSSSIGSVTAPPEALGSQRSWSVRSKHIPYTEEGVTNAYEKYMYSKNELIGHMQRLDRNPLTVEKLERAKAINEFEYRVLDNQYLKTLNAERTKKFKNRRYYTSSQLKEAIRKLVTHHPPPAITSIRQPGRFGK